MNRQRATPRCRGKAGISLVGSWRCAKVPRGTVQLYGRIRTATDINGQLRTTDLLECCDKPYLHKPRKRRYTQTTTRLLGFSPTIGAQPNRRQAEPTTTSRLSGFSAGRQAQKSATKERYRAAIRWFCQGEAEGVNFRSRPRLSPPTRPAGASENAPLFFTAVP